MVPARPLAKQETPTPSGIANMDYFQRPPAVASPLRRLLMGNLVTVARLALPGSAEAFPTMPVHLRAAKDSKGKSNADS
ncbi:hypothetical protein HBI56_230290 [Parastagonospora nodorum]|nr:hypothetical protein HBH49_236210 [Parastagonospora nodorum]KAH4112496.1 hypothetical protein HBH47_226010 [Parastagonospora nodorum]KAH4181233.1 hypothetical protein HBH42_241200 [Parastagonospora nodorum]KAH4188980.1 hypothetical protein HBI95_225560 [Parastagonospora nodorum]KAH4336239.1 hypothetical protein HBH98_230630 [Parastagonospora nodorum]